MRRSAGVIWLLVFGLAMLLAPGAQAHPLASLSWSRYDVDIRVNTDGTLTVTEIQTIAFTGGQSFRKGFAVIPQQRGSIGDVKVWEGAQTYTPSYANQPYTFETSTDDNGDLEIVWYFPPTSNSTHTYNLQYTVRDGVLFYADRGYDRLQWKAVPLDHDSPIAASTVTVSVPSGATILRAGAANDSPAASRVAPDQLSATFDSTGVLRSGQGIEVRIDFQHGMVTGTPPSWQFIYDLQEQYKPLIDLISLVLGALIVIGGTLLLVMRWYTRGRDPQTGIAAEYVSEPPSDLPPGIVGTLLDERADMADIIGTLIDLARRGFITMEELNTPGFMGIGSSRDFVFRRVPDADVSKLRAYERLVLDRVVPNDERKLSQLKYKFYQHIGEIQTALYKEVVAERLFPVRPDTTRTRWAVAAQPWWASAIVLGIGLLAVLSDVTFSVIVPAAALGLVGVIVMVASSAMPVKSRQGSEAASAWQAFKRYLSNLERYTQVQEATDQFEKYLPYAIAFGIERSWINKFARVDTMPIPGWYYPYGWGRGYYGGGRATGGLGDGGGVPSVQGMSDNLAGSFRNMSTGLSTMLNSAASTFSSVPQSSGRGGGGWSGGGFSGGGGGGGGSRGFG